jgi:hypothetical protein
MKIIRSLRNPWVLTPLLVLLALIITATAAEELPSHYQAESNVALLPSVNSSKAYGYNPYMNFSGALPMTAQIVAYQLMNPRNVQKLKTQGYNEPFTVGIASAVTNGPILTTVVTGSDKAAVQATLNGVTREISGDVTSMQKGISKTNRITILPISADLTPKLMISKTVRPLVLVLVIGLFLAFAIPRMMAGKGRGAVRGIPDRATRRNPLPAVGRDMTLDFPSVYDGQPNPSGWSERDHEKNPPPAEPSSPDPRIPSIEESARNDMLRQRSHGQPYETLTAQPEDWHVSAHRKA